MDPIVRNVYHSTMMHHGDVPPLKKSTNANVSQRRLKLKSIANSSQWDWFSQHFYDSYSSARNFQPDI